MTATTATTTTTTNAAGNEPTLTAALAVGIAVVAYGLTAHLVPLLAGDLVAKRLRGRDMLKPGFARKQDDGDGDTPTSEWIPEATGVIGASVYILLLSLSAPLPYLSSLVSSDSSLAGDFNFPHHSFATYLASLLSLLIATFLGFCDDVFDIRWRFKLPIPLIASVPLLVTYAAGHGVTDVVIPNLLGLRSLLDVVSTNGVLHLGGLYYLYMSMLSTFCTNSINILAGINGVEVSQALVIALSLILNDVLYLPFRPAALVVAFSPSTSSWWPSSSLAAIDKVVDALERIGTVSIGMDNGSSELQDRHLFSLFFMVPLVGVCLGLLKHNWYPSRAFVGDTFCYFSGMSFAVTAILSHYSKTLLLFFLPQIFNFVYSTPQLFGLVPCPRHRLPKLDPESGKLEPSWCVLRPREVRTVRERVGVKVLVGAEKIGLVKLKRRKVVGDDKHGEGGRERGGGGEVEASTNLTILNLILLWKGQTREDDLCRWLIAVQVAGSIVAFGVRYGLGAWIYGVGGDRR